MNHISYIYPGTQPCDTEGKKIQAHGAGMFYENGTYYWYGENKEFTNGKNKIWTSGIRFYSSEDLYNWKDEGLVIPPDLKNENATLHPKQHVDRPHIVYVKESKKYVCWLKISAKTGYFTVLTADHLLGPYIIVRDRFMPFGLAAGDFDLWINDEDGKGYLFFEHDHTGVAICELTADCTDVQGEFKDCFTGLKPPYVREGITHFVYKGKHYLLSSGMTGYIPNPSEIAVSNDPMGPYTVLGNPHFNDNSSASFNSQISYVFQDPQRPELYLVMADRWVPRYKMTKEKYEKMERVITAVYDKKRKAGIKDYISMIGAPFGSANTSIAEYVFLPLQFDGEFPQLVWQDRWNVEQYRFHYGV